MDLTPLRHRNFRLLYFGQFISFFGSMMSYVALPYVLYQATRSTALTGLLGVIQLVPTVVGALFGGTLADAVDRRRLIVACEFAMALIVLALGLALHGLAPRYPPAYWLLAAGATLAIINGIHRPALEALSPQLIEKHEQAPVAVLTSLRSSIGMIGGPALTGILIGVGGADLAFFLDFGSFVLCVIALLAMHDVPRGERVAELSLAAVSEGFRYALSREVLIGTYLVDIVAMTFSMPNLLFPAVADAFGSPIYLGWLHSGIAGGALLATFSSRWYVRARHHGLMILIAAGSWSACMIGFGLSHSFPLAMFFLVLAGYADSVSGVFRQTIWNQTIPNELRGRLAGIEMISYLTGPLLGNTQLGFLSGAVGIQRAITLSSLIGLSGVIACARLLPGFRKYATAHAQPELSVAS